jgi:hypothetical protein
MTDLTRDELKEFLDYNPLTGQFTRKASPVKNQTKPGDIAGCLHVSGYIKIKVKNKVYSAHRLAWLYMVGDWPQLEIDHIDGNKANNVWSNLRQSTRSQNQANRGKNKNNRSEYKGVSWHKASKSWAGQVGIMENGKRKTIWKGGFKTKLEAYIWYCEASEFYHGEYYRG